MKDQSKTKQELIQELISLRQMIEELEQSVAERKQAEEMLLESEATLRALINAPTDSILLLDSRGVIVNLNKIAAERFGKSRDELIGTLADNLLPENIAERRRSMISQIFEPDRTVRFEDVRDGIWYDTIAYPILDKDGAVSRIAVIARDITEHKQAEERLRESEGKLNAMLQSIPDHMSVIDKELNIVWANETATQMFGSNIIGRKCYEAYHKRKEPCEPYPCITLKAFKDGGIHEHNTDVVDTGGKTIYFQCTANVVLRNKDDKPITVLEISRDITERKQAEEELINHRRQLEELVKERTVELEIKSRMLDDINIALKVLLRQRDVEKQDLEDRFVLNIKTLILPYIEKMKSDGIDKHLKAYLSIMESNLNELLSPLMHNMRQLNFTPKEIMVSSLIKEGKTTKDIAKTMRVGTSAIDSHRNRIRKKLGLNKRNANLQSYLHSLK
jgi:PAS domain S-box-containing protein